MSTYARKELCAVALLQLAICSFPGPSLAETRGLDLNVQDRMEQFIYKPPIEIAPPRAKASADRRVRHAPRARHAKHPKRNIK